MLQLFALLGAVGMIPSANAALCRGYYGSYNCNNSGLSTGARIGIGIGIAAAVIALFAACSYWRRKQLRNQFSKFRPPVLPVSGGNHQATNPYANNPPPPPAQAGSYYNQSSNWNNNQYGQNPSTPANVYQPSMAGQYGNRDGAKENGNVVSDGNNEHGYEWEQAREAERLEREQGGGGAPPPGYEVSSNPTGSTNTGYAPPAGPPPKNVVS